MAKRTAALSEQPGLLLDWAGRVTLVDDLPFMAPAALPPGPNRIGVVAAGAAVPLHRRRMAGFGPLRTEPSWQPPPTDAPTVR